jgi:cytochrome c5
MGAPKIGDSADWQARFKSAGSIGGLLTTTQHGKGNMPARGGESSLSDTELQSAIQYMLSKSGVAY